MSNPYDPPQSRPSRAVLISRALRLRCPLCGTGQLFRTWFKMKPACAHCRLKFEREPGYYLGSIYINYGLTAVLMTLGYMLGVVFKWAAPSTLLWTGVRVHDHVPTADVSVFARAVAGVRSSLGSAGGERFRRGHGTSGGKRIVGAAVPQWA
jgi:uncharacterized protein (DUF983 family)